MKFQAAAKIPPFLETKTRYKDVIFNVLIG